MKAIEALVEAALAAELGSAVAVSVGDAGREVFRTVQGHTRRVPDVGAPVDEWTYFDLASLTKPMATAACAMVLAADDRLDLDAPVRRWISEAATTGTVRQLLGHAAGCAAHVEIFRVLAAASPPDPRAALVALAAAEPTAMPGTALYSDLGYILLGEILARAAAQSLEEVFTELVVDPLALTARYVRRAYPAIEGAVATELDRLDTDSVTHTALPTGAAALPTRAAAPTTRRGMGRGLVAGRVHDENAYFGGGVCGHAGVFGTLTDVARFAAAIVDSAGGLARGRFTPAIVQHFTGAAAASGTSWRLGWDTPSATPGVSHAGDRWPRTGGIGHLGFTGTSLWLDLPRRRWCALLTNRVHPTRHGGSAEAIKSLRRAVNDAAIAALDD